MAPGIHTDWNERYFVDECLLFLDRNKVWQVVDAIWCTGHLAIANGACHCVSVDGWDQAGRRMEVSGVCVLGKYCFCVHVLCVLLYSTNKMPLVRAHQPPLASRIEGRVLLQANDGS